MARANIKVDIKVAELVEAKAMAIAVDQVFADLVANVPELRQTDNHNQILAARESLKIALIKPTGDAS